MSPLSPLHGWVQANAFTPLMFIEQDPQMPSRQERLKTSVESISSLISKSTSSTMGAQVLVSTS